MKKRLVALALVLALALTVMPALAGGLITNSLQLIDQNKETAAPPAQEVSDAELTTPYGQRIFDHAQLLTPAQEADINKRIAQFQKDYEMDFVVVTYNGPFRMGSAQEDADIFYEDGCRAGVLGNVEDASDDEDSGMLLYINWDQGEYHVSTTGRMIDYITDERANALNNELLSNLRSARQTGNFAVCVTSLINSTGVYIKKGIPEGQFQYDVVTGQMLTSRHQALTSNEIVVSGGIGLIVALIFVFSVKGNYNLKRNTYSYSFKKNSRMNLTHDTDQYLRSSVSRTRRYTDSGRGSGGGGFSGGSGVHVSSGGGSHGGFGGKF